MTEIHKQNFDKVVRLIEMQQKGRENSAVFFVGEQLKEIAEREEKSCELLARDLEIPEMSIEKAEAEIKAYSDKNRGSHRSFCVSGRIADGILRKFYGLPKIEEAQAEKKTDNACDVAIDLANFF